MKKIISAILLIALTLLTFASCTTPSGDDTVIKIGYMEGPTGMGMAKLIHDNGGTTGNEKYKFEKFGDAADATAALLSGKIDAACLPTNNASIIYNTKGESVKVLAVNCLNSLYILTKSGTEITSFEELDGKTVYTIANGTPKVILNHALTQKGINATVSTEAVINGNTKTLATPADLASAIIAGAVDIALVPEPVATAAPLKVVAEGKDYTYKVAINLTDVWSEISETPVAMGCIVARADFVNENKSAIDKFLKEYKASIEYVSNKTNLNTAASYIVEAGVLGAEGPAKKSLTNLGNAIAYIDGDEMKNVLVDFYGRINPQLIGGKIPDEKFFYKK